MLTGVGMAEESLPLTQQYDPTFSNSLISLVYLPAEPIYSRVGRTACSKLQVLPQAKTLASQG